jgi:hypothetical protein
MANGSAPASLLRPAPAAGAPPRPVRVVRSSICWRSWRSCSWGSQGAACACWRRQGGGLRCVGSSCRCGRGGCQQGAAYLRPRCRRPAQQRLVLGFQLALLQPQVLQLQGARGNSSDEAAASTSTLPPRAGRRPQAPTCCSTSFARAAFRTTMCMRAACGASVHRTRHACVARIPTRPLRRSPAAPAGPHLLARDERRHVLQGLCRAGDEVIELDPSVDEELPALDGGHGRCCRHTMARWQMARADGCRGHQVGLEKKSCDPAVKRQHS